jgi:lincosamide nucleotidyltransferase A/C/D/E
MTFRETALPDVLAFLDLVDELQIPIWIDGGWGVDALLGEQTRWHGDLDIVVEARHSATLVQHLKLRGFAPVPRDDTAPWNFVYGDAHGREVDFHLIEFDADGNGQFGPEDVYPVASLTGVGVIGDRTVRCISPEYLVRFHTGYEPDDDDWHDVSMLCERFGIAVPGEYERFRGS